MKKSTVKKRLIVTVIITLVLVFLSASALMLYPIYGFLFKNAPSVEIHKTVNINGVDTSYHRIETLNNDSMLIPFIKGELIEMTESYSVYEWKLDLANKNDYLIFEIYRSIEEESSNGPLADSELLEELKKSSSYFEIYKKDN